MKVSEARRTQWRGLCDKLRISADKRRQTCFVKFRFAELKIVRRSSRVRWGGEGQHGRSQVHVPKIPTTYYHFILSINNTVYIYCRIHACLPRLGVRPLSTDTIFMRRIHSAKPISSAFGLRFMFTNLFLPHTHSKRYTDIYIYSWLSLNNLRILIEKRMFYYSPLKLNIFCWKIQYSCNSKHCLEAKTGNMKCKPAEYEFY